MALVKRKEKKNPKKREKKGNFCNLFSLNHYIDCPIRAKRVWISITSS